jgi:hypothetical protein
MRLGCICEDNKKKVYHKELSVRSGLAQTGSKYGPLGDLVASIVISLVNVL